MFALGNSSTIFARVTVLSDEVAGVAGKHKIIYGVFRSLGHFHRFADVGKMIGNTMSRHLTGSSCFIDNGFEILPLLIVEQVVEVAFMEVPWK